MDGDDLYGDLDTSTSALEKTEALQLKTKAEEENAKLRQELAILQTQNQQLGRANQVLETNISKLYVTAQHELKRKDKEIQRLREELEVLTQQQVYHHIGNTENSQHRTDNGR